MKNFKIITLLTLLSYSFSILLIYVILVNVIGLDKGSVVAILIPTTIATAITVYYALGKLKLKLASEGRHNHTIKADEK